MQFAIWLMLSLAWPCGCLPLQSGAGLVLPSDAQPWSSGGIGGPVVQPPQDGGQKWRMWYYGCAADGRNTSEFPSCPGGIPYGCIGVAESTDGMHWEASPKNPVFLHSDADDAFDSVRVAVGSVVRWRDHLAMFYFGSNSSFSPAIGLAVSDDDGYTWERVRGSAGGGAVLRSEPAVEGALATTQPHVLVLDSGHLRMYYVALKFGATGPEFALWQADSRDGVTWTNKKQLQLPKVGSGIGSFGVLKMSAAELLVFAGWELPGQQDAIGVLQGGLDSTTFELPQGAADKEVLLPSKTSGAWDEFAVGCPHPLVNQGQLYVYFNGFEKPNAAGKARSCIGLAIAQNATDYLHLKRVELGALVAV